MEDFTNQDVKGTFVAYDPEVQLQLWLGIMKKEMPKPAPITLHMINEISKEVAYLKKLKKKKAKQKAITEDAKAIAPHNSDGEIDITIIGFLILIAIIVARGVVYESEKKILTN